MPPTSRGGLALECRNGARNQTHGALREVSATMIPTDPTELLPALQQLLRDSIITTTVDEDQPQPDLTLLQLWAERRKADVAASRNPTTPVGTDTSMKIHPDYHQQTDQVTTSRSGGHTLPTSLPQNSTRRPLSISFLSSTHTCIQGHQRYTSQEADPLVMELQAIHDAIQAVTTKLPTIRHIHIFTDSSAAIRELKKVSKAMELCQRIHTLHRNTSTCIKVYWIQGHATNQYNLAADKQAHFPSDPDLPSLPLPCEPLSLLHARKHSLRQDTRALIPTCVCSFPRHLTRVEEVVLQRLRAGVALTPVVTSTWSSPPGARRATCPKCPLDATEADVRHLIWTCPGLQTERTRLLIAPGLQHSAPTSYQKPIGLLPDYATGVVLTACVRHNYLRDNKLHMPDAYADKVDHFGNITDDQWCKKASQQKNALFHLPRLRPHHLNQSARKRNTVATA
ncbi:hypothetical protein HPB47_001464 [Ixodes persulcatus]|uniref:Uncharacterized protein n=1 Tax=Ixodes persulcatus TaxID=34615 RepID=A0AC60PQG6_IXOPE|nr:hypothetical protein HPB47_001464 [Ixodes persulcatus]